MSGVGAAAVPEAWAAAEFGAVPLSDRRRVARVVALAAAMLREPGASIPRLGGTAYGAKAAYALFAHPEATPDALQAAHRARVLDAMHTPGAYLLLEDTTDVVWPGGVPRDGLGLVRQSGGGHYQGFLLHSVLAARWPETAARAAAAPGARHRAVELLGLIDQQYYVTTSAPRARPGSRSASAPGWRASASPGCGRMPRRA